jgi:hypothetical protein
MGMIEPELIDLYFMVQKLSKVNHHASCIGYESAMLVNGTVMHAISVLIGRLDPIRSFQQICIWPLCACVRHMTYHHFNIFYGGYGYWPS